MIFCEQPSLLLLAGLPASGKSTLTRRLKALGAVIISLDAIRAELGDVTDQSRNADVLAIAQMRVEAALLDGQWVVLDATNLRHAWRARWERLAAELNVPIRIHWVRTPLLVCLWRNWRRERRVPVRVILRLWRETDS